MRLIDADALLEKSFKYRMGEFTTMTVVLANKVKIAPTIDAVPVVHGHWIIEKTATGSEYTRCNKCGLDFSWNDRMYGLHKLDMRGCDFCPACGAKMDEVR